MPKKVQTQDQDSPQPSFLQGKVISNIGVFASPDWKSPHRVVDAFSGFEKTNSCFSTLDENAAISAILKDFAKRKEIPLFTISLKDLNTSTPKLFTESVKSYFVYDYCFFFQKGHSTMLTTLMDIAKQKNIPYSIIKE